MVSRVTSDSSVTNTGKSFVAIIGIGREKHRALKKSIIDVVDVFFPFTVFPILMQLQIAFKKGEATFILVLSRPPHHVGNPLHSIDTQRVLSVILLSAPPNPNLLPQPFFFGLTLLSSKINEPFTSKLYGPVATLAKYLAYALPNIYTSHDMATT